MLIQFRYARRFCWTAASTLLALSLPGCGGGGDGGAVNTEPALNTAQQACTAVAGKTVGPAAITSATLIAASGPMPSYCKVNATISPSLKMELSVPANWNGRMLYAGGGGYDGSIPGPIDFPGPFSPGTLASGYAVVASNGGHDGSPLDASFASDPYLAYLFGSGSVPMTADAAKGILRVATGKAPEHSYFEGCSNGGREALMAAQRNPDLFDGIIARAPAMNWTGTMGAFNRTAKALAGTGGSLSAAKVALLAGAVRSACDANDGIVDGIVANPASCSYDPKALRCPGGGDAGNACLSDAQLASVAAWTTAASFGGGAFTSPGWALSGNEDDPGGWATWSTGATGDGSAGLQNFLQDTTVKSYLARDNGINSLAYDYNSNAAALYGLASVNDATNTDLRPFKSTGGKLILWHGLSDSALTYRATTAYYEGVKATLGSQLAVDEFVRYYQAPGVNHCNGGPGADSVDLLSALDKWVSQGAGPTTVVASKSNADGSTAFARPLCRHPQYARYTGGANDAAAAKLASNYICATP